MKNKKKELDELIKNKSLALTNKIISGDFTNSLDKEVAELKDIKDLSDIYSSSIKSTRIYKYIFPFVLLLFFLIVILLINQPVNNLGFDARLKTSQVTFNSDERQVLDGFKFKDAVIRNYDKIFIDDVKTNYTEKTITISGLINMYIVFGKNGSSYNIMKLKEKNRYLLRFSGMEPHNNEEYSIVFFEIGQKILNVNGKKISTKDGARVLCYVNPDMPSYLEVEFSLDSTMERSIVNQIEARSLSFTNFIRFEPKWFVYDTKSNIIEGKLNLTDYDKAINLEDREYLYFDNGRGIINNVVLDENSISVYYSGAAKKIIKGSHIHPKDITPSKLEWLISNRKVTLIYAAIASVLAFLFSLLQWWKSL